ncbi:MAG TPA: GGDEF domain-containing protein [Usitatibacter sp.]|nr:GGDEF domain-containing protein [Usitatibacter sp.]
MTIIVRVAIIAVTIALFVHSSLHAMLGHRDIAVLSALATPLGISSWGFARAGHHEAAIMLLSGVLLTVVTLVLMLNPLGVHDVAITAYGGIVLVAALLLSRPNFLVITGLTMIAAAAVFALEMTGHTRSVVKLASEWPQLATFFLVTIVFATIGRVASETLFGSLGILRLAAVGDPVTGLANRDGFIAKATALLRAARADNRPCALVLADLDGFRRIKVVVGYAAADRVVAEAARRLAAIAGGHLVGRIADDEFALLARGVEGDAAVGLAREVRQALEFDFSGVAVRCAVGFARFPRDGDDVDALLLAAEGSLLSAKSAVGGERLAGPADRI